MKKTITKRTVQRLVQKKEEILAQPDRNGTAVRIQSDIELEFDTELAKKLDSQFLKGI